MKQLCWLVLLFFLAGVALWRGSVLWGHWALNQGVVAFAKGDAESAQPFLQEATENDTVRAWWTVGLLAARAGEEETAVAAWRNLPGSADVLLAYGQAEVTKRDWPAAQVWFERAVAVAPQASEAHFWLGRALYEQGLWLEAQTELTTAVALAPDDSVQALTYLSRTDSQLGDSTQAIALLRQAVALHPDDFDLLFTLGNLYRAEGNLPEAIIWLAQAAQHPQHSVQSLLDSAELYRQLNQPLEALPLAEQAVAEAPASWSAWLVLGEVNTDLGRYGEAVAVLQKATAVDSQVAAVWLALGIALDGNGDTVNAQAAYQQALALDPSLNEAQQRVTPSP